MPPKGALGQALALSPGQAKQWLDFVREHATTRLWVLLNLTFMLALRPSEACCLQGADFDLGADPPHLKIRKMVRTRKSPGNIPLVPAMVNWIRKLHKKGVSVRRKRKTSKGNKMYTDTFMMPCRGPIFKSRGGAGSKHLSYHGVWAQVRRLAARFEVAHPDHGFAAIRAHSGRASAITTLMTKNVPLPITMKFARHKAIKTHLRYERLVLSDVYSSLMQVEHPELAMKEQTAMCTALLEGSGTDVATTARPSVDPAPPPTTGKPGRPVLKPTTTFEDLIQWRREGLVNETEFQKLKTHLLSVE
jgi:hypothetical protein